MKKSIILFTISIFLAYSSVWAQYTNGNVGVVVNPFQLPQSLPNGTSGQVLATNGTGIGWITPTSGITGSGISPDLSYWSSSTGLTYTPNFQINQTGDVGSMQTYKPIYGENGTIIDLNFPYGGHNSTYIGNDSINGSGSHLILYNFGLEFDNSGQECLLSNHSATSIRTSGGEIFEFGDGGSSWVTTNGSRFTINGDGLTTQGGYWQFQLPNNPNENMLMSYPTRIGFNIDTLLMQSDTLPKSTLKYSAQIATQTAVHDTVIAHLNSTGGAKGGEGFIQYDSSGHFAGSPNFSINTTGDIGSMQAYKIIYGADSSRLQLTYPGLKPLFWLGDTTINNGEGVFGYGAAHELGLIVHSQPVFTATPTQLNLYYHGHSLLSANDGLIQLVCSDGATSLNLVPVNGFSLQCAYNTGLQIIHVSGSTLTIMPPTMNPVFDTLYTSWHSVVHYHDTILTQYDTVRYVSTPTRLHDSVQNLVNFNDSIGGSKHVNNTQFATAYSLTQDTANGLNYLTGIPYMKSYVNEQIHIGNFINVNDTIGGSGHLGTATQIPTPYSTNTIQDYTAAFPFTVFANSQHLIINSSGTVANLTINFPDLPKNQEIFVIHTTQNITTVTLQSGIGGSTIQNTFTSMLSGAHSGWIYDALLNEWISN
jgi:hypothetical protein